MWIGCLSCLLCVPWVLLGSSFVTVARVVTAALVEEFAAL